MSLQKIAATLLVGALAFLCSPQLAECHKNHCHGPGLQVCGGGWKDHKEQVTHVGPEGGASSQSAACSSAVDELEESLAVEAHTRCPELHPCATCPNRCRGCKQVNPMGRIVDDKRVRKTPKKRADGSWECTLKTEVAFRCRCSGCKVKNPTP